MSFFVLLGVSPGRLGLHYLLAFVLPSSPPSKQATCIGGHKDTRCWLWPGCTTIPLCVGEHRRYFKLLDYITTLATSY
jgi:hypothetical protein